MGCEVARRHANVGELRQRRDQVEAQNAAAAQRAHVVIERVDVAIRELEIAGPDDRVAGLVVVRPFGPPRHFDGGIPGGAAVLVVRGGRLLEIGEDLVVVGVGRVVVRHVPGVLVRDDCPPGVRQRRGPGRHDQPKHAFGGVGGLPHAWVRIAAASFGP
jgi:hypothetical protein